MHLGECIGRAWGAGACMYPDSRPQPPRRSSTQPSPVVAQQQQAKPAREWNIRGVLLATEPVVASVGAYDTSSRVHRRSLVCGGCIYVSLLPNTPTTTIYNQLPPDKTTHPPAAAAENHAREVAHPGCTSWLYVVVACIGAYDAAPGIGSGQKLGARAHVQHDNTA